MSLKTDTPLGQIAQHICEQQRLMVRTTYINVIHYLMELSPHFEISNDNVAMRDLGRNLVSLVGSNRTDWPPRLDGSVHDCPNPLFGLLTYRKTELGIFIGDSADLYFKFPTVISQIWKLNNSKFSNWTRQVRLPHYYAPTAPEPFELKAFEAGRAPIASELTREVIHIMPKNELHAFIINLNSSINIQEVVEEKYKKYLTGLEKSKTSLARSLVSVHKKYMTIRGTPAFTRWKAPQAVT